ncbi:uncharacterized protein Z519_06013 [Cladophialophora bantiana CBS 173.52]|uniref:Uncharacterized protein n=1 Tax=Cladophialophora bantiana (strain ATCC 10958 / CBS 173.52 / CDC B-1940 / NIH 8579) TaxID=1442370 RepID=A0A0D2HJD1_CLAB1|nr:uncharacterized protein Z519_06013 [Cladophialophora bantiana CBS 173.52]KIW93408.1 hypothetical protein Z519_06013 [Cladophialophora bantiana CBS 173.52]
MSITVRWPVGPNDLSFRTESATSLIYKGGRSLPETKFYDGFTAFNPNLFGTQDEYIHAVRCLQMAHSFSLQSIKVMEPFIDRHIKLLRKNQDQAADSGVVINFKELITYCVFEVLGDLAFSQSFDSQKIQDHTTNYRQSTITFI